MEMLTQAQLDMELDRLEAAEACRNLAGRLMYYDTAFRAGDIIKLWSRRGNEYLLCKDGEYRGYSAVCEFISARYSTPREGRMGVHQLNTEVLSIAEDCQSAVGIWVSPGFDTQPDALATGVSQWEWNKIEIRFVREEEVWRINSLRIFPVLRSKFGEPWTKLPAKPNLKVGDTEMWVWAPDRFHPADQPPIPEKD